ALDDVPAGVLVGDGRRGPLPGPLVDQHRTGLRGRLNPRRGVDAVTDDQSLGRVVERSYLPRDDPRTRLQIAVTDLVAEHAYGVHDLERRPDRALGVILACDRRAPDRHHRIADELLDHAAVTLDDRPCRVEVAAEKFAHVLGVA